MIVQKYANLLFEQSRDKVTLDEISLIASGICADSLVSRYFSSPANKTEKERVLSEMLSAAEASNVASNFLKLIIRHKRLKELPSILEEYTRLLNTMNGEKMAEVISSKALNKDDQIELISLLESKLGAKVVVKYTTDPSIIGGIVVKCGSVFLDASIKGALDKISVI
ncbi:MAG: ATP synthase F1 subunit delta [Pseudomonadota bacterium]